MALGCYVIRKTPHGNFIVHAPSYLDPVGRIVATAESRQHAQAIVRRLKSERVAHA